MVSSNVNRRKEIQLDNMQNALNLKQIQPEIISKR
jgi:hypothetical protein